MDGQLKSSMIPLLGCLTTKTTQISFQTFVYAFGLPIYLWVVGGAFIQLCVCLVGGTFLTKNVW